MSPGRDEERGEKYEALEYASFFLYIKYGESATHGYQISSLTNLQMKNITSVKAYEKWPSRLLCT